MNLNLSDIGKSRLCVTTGNNTVPSSYLQKIIEGGIFVGFRKYDGIIVQKNILTHPTSLHTLSSHPAFAHCKSVSKGNFHRSFLSRSIPNSLLTSYIPYHDERTS